MPKPDFKNEPFRFNRWYASEYNSEATNIADDFYEADRECNYALLAAHWLVMNQDGKKIDPVFSVAEILIASRKEGWTPDPRARVINACWLGYVRWKMDIPDVVILPPTPEPPKVEEPKKLPEIHLPQEPKKNPAAWLVKFSVYFGIVSTVVGVVAWFVPGAKPWVAVIVPVIQAILKAFGV